jgi:hypothetical protein
MSNNGRSSESGKPGMPWGKKNDVGVPPESAPVGDKSAHKADGFVDMQSAMRFPIKLPVSLKSKSGERHAETENISANGVLFQVIDAEMPVGSMVDFTISLPADIVGSTADVQLDCRGRVVRSFEEGGRRGVGVVIDEYRFERR